MSKRPKCPKVSSDPALQAAFQHMYEAEAALDDMDYIEHSPKLELALKAAAEFRRLMDESDRK